MDGDEVGLNQQRLEGRHDIDAHLLRPFRGHVRVERDHAHAEGEGTRGNECPDAPQSDDPQRLPLQLHALPFRPLPPAGLQIRVRLWDVPGLGQQKCDRVFGRGDDVGLRGVHDHHASPGRGIDVDVVDADARSRDHLEVLGGS